jgi:hypothetical protein
LPKDNQPKQFYPIKSQTVYCLFWFLLDVLKFILANTLVTFIDTNYFDIISQYIRIQWKQKADRVNQLRFISSSGGDEFKCDTSHTL